MRLGGRKHKLAARKPLSKYIQPIHSLQSSPRMRVTWFCCILFFKLVMIWCIEKKLLKKSTYKTWAETGQRCSGDGQEARGSIKVEE